MDDLEIDEAFRKYLKLVNNLCLNTNEKPKKLDYKRKIKTKGESK